MRKILAVEHFAWCQMKKNYQIYLPFQFHLRAQSAGRGAQLSRKKIKTLFLSNMSKSRRLTSTFFPMIENKQNKMSKNTNKLSCTCMLRHTYRITNLEDKDCAMEAKWAEILTITFIHAHRWPAMLTDMLSCICMLRQHLCIYCTLNH